MKIRQVGAEFFHAERHGSKDRHDEATSSFFCYFTNESKNEYKASNKSMAVECVAVQWEGGNVQKVSPTVVLAAMQVHVSCWSHSSFIHTRLSTR